MPLYPGAIQRPIPPGANDPRITVLGAILHTDAGNSKSLFGYFNGPSGGIESHFHIPKVGRPEQYRDTAFEADANLHGNSFLHNGKLYGYASIETQGYATDEWNPYQLAEIKKLLLWLSQTHKFPLVKCASATSPGVGYHTMWGAPGPWTPVAKDCPGAKRIKQFGNTLVPWFQTATPPKDGFTVAEADRVIEFIKDRFATDGPEGMRWQQVIHEGRDQQAALLAAINEQTAAIQALTAALQQKG